MYLKARWVQDKYIAARIFYDKKQQSYYTKYQSGQNWLYIR